MDLDSDEQALQAVLGREDFGGIDNVAIDFSDLDDYLNDDGDKTSSFFQSELINTEAKAACEAKAVIRPPCSTNGQLSTFLANNIANVITDPSTIPSLNSAIHKGIIANINVNLPDSPPDSGSEPPFSPLHTDSSLNGNEDISAARSKMMQTSGDLKYMGYTTTQPLKHLTETSLTLTPPLQMTNQQQASLNQQHSSVGPPLQAQGGSMMGHLQHAIPTSLNAAMGMPQPGLNTPHLTALYDSSDDFLCDSLESTSSNHKKRKLTDNHKNVVNTNLLNGMMSVKQEAGGISPEPHTNTPILSTTDDEYSFDFSGPDGSGMFLDSAYQCIRFQPFQQNTWAILCDHTLKELPPPNYRVDADKGFNFSNADDAFVCQKKNHFQVTVHVQPMGEPQYVKSPDGVKKIDHFYLHFNGAKVESPNQTIKVEQSQSDRSKRPFHPVPLDLTPEQVSKTTVGRLHFSETTSNNMRKKGKPNPDQRYFYLVVSLCVASGDQNYTVISHASERIIVRASNPGQFENDMELSWQRGQLADSIYHAGRVGINTDRPDEALVIHGNMKVTGHIVQPSDARAKTNIEEVDTKEQLKNVANMRIVRYQYLPEFAKQVGLGEENSTSTGVIAQEVQTLIPDAVQGTGDVFLPDGQQIENFLVVNKDRIFMENIGAVKELCKVTDNLGTRIDELEKVNKKLTRHKVKRLDSLKSTSSGSTITSHASSFNSSKKVPQYHHHYRRAPSKKCIEENNLCNSSYLQIIMLILILIMAFCIVAFIAIYILEMNNRYVSTLPLHTSREKISYFNVTTRENSRQAFLEFEKSKSFENSVAEQDRKEGRTLDTDRMLPTRRPSTSWFTTESSSISSTLSTTPRPHQRHYHTLVPVLKPRVVGSPDHCRYVHREHTDCTLYCCSLSANQRKALPESNEDLSYYSKSLSEKVESERLSLENIDHSLSELDDYSMRLDTATTTESYPNSDKSTSHIIEPLVSPAELEDHPVHQNQLKPVRGEAQRLKLMADRNVTAEANDAEIEKIVVSSQLEHKFKNILKSEKMAEGEMDRRTRRGVKPFIRKDLPKAIESLRLLELNATVGTEYCNTLNCAVKSGPRFNYLIPMSKYMTEEYVTLQFNLGMPLIVDHCQPDAKPVACPVPQNGAGDLPHDYIRDQNLTEEIDPSWRLPIGLYFRSTYRFRIQARSIVSTTPCALPVTELGHSYIELVLVFQRSCDK